MLGLPPFRLFLERAGGGDGADALPRDPRDLAATGFELVETALHRGVLRQRVAEVKSAIAPVSNGKSARAAPDAKTGAFRARLSAGTVRRRITVLAGGSYSPPLASADNIDMAVSHGTGGPGVVVVHAAVEWQARVTSGNAPRIRPLIDAFQHDGRAVEIAAQVHV